MYVTVGNLIRWACGVISLAGDGRPVWGTVLEIVVRVAVTQIIALATFSSVEASVGGRRLPQAVAGVGLGWLLADDFRVREPVRRTIRHNDSEAQATV